MALSKFTSNSGAADTADVVIIGGGCAGISAFKRLTDTRRRVLLLEKEKVLGGRAQSQNYPSPRLTLDNGQHMLMGCYAATFANVSTAKQQQYFKVFPYQTLTFGPSLGSPAVHRFNPQTRLPGMHYLKAAWGSGLFQGSDIKALLKLGLKMAFGEKNTTVDIWLDRCGFSPGSRLKFWQIFNRSIFNADEKDISVRFFSQVLRRAFLGAARNAFPVYVTTGLSELWHDLMAPHADEVYCGWKVSAISQSQDQWYTVESETRTLRAKSILLALDPPALKKVRWPNLPETQTDLQGYINRFHANGILTAYLWTQKPLQHELMRAYWDDTLADWSIRNDFFERDAHPARFKTSLVCSHPSDWMHQPASLYQEAVKKRLGPVLHAQGNRLLDMKVKKVPHATFFDNSGGKLDTDALPPGVFMAGDWTHPNLPCTIEAACESGHQAAQKIAHYLSKVT